MTALFHNPPLLFLTGLIAMVAGLAVVLGHIAWSGGALPVVVTLVGSVALMKGVLILIPITPARHPPHLERVQRH